MRSSAAATGEAVKKYGENNWIAVQKDMQLHRRTSAQCLQRFTKNLAAGKKGPWEPVEKLQLDYAVWESGAHT